MGKTNLVPSLTYFTEQEYAARKLAARAASISISNLNRAGLGYAMFKQGKPKKKAAQDEANIAAENSISFENLSENSFVETVDDVQESPKLIDNSAKLDVSAEMLVNLLPTESDVEDAFENLFNFAVEEDKEMIERVEEQRVPVGEFSD